MSRFLCVYWLLGLLLLAGFSLVSCGNDSEAPPDTVSSAVPTRTEIAPVYTYTIVNTYPHDRQAFTQGLVFDQGGLYEGTGLRGQSSLRRVDVTTGAILQRRPLAARFFGEGITVLGEQIMQLTWRSHVGFVYDRRNFILLRQFTYDTEGWGITHDGSRLIMSDGTSNLYFLDPKTFQEISRVEVRDHTGPVHRLNELEYIQGQVYANIWQTDRIARIDPGTGWVTAWIDLTGLLPLEDRLQGADVLNGIAYDAERDRLFVTGKLWPKLFEIKIVVP